MELSILSKVAWLGEFPSPSYSIFIPRIGQYSGSSKSVYFKSKYIPLLLAQYLEFLITELSERKKDGSLDHIDDLLPWAKTPQKECKVPIKKS